MKRFGAAVVLLLLLVPLGSSVGQMLHGRMLQWGQEIWPGYAIFRATCAPPAEEELSPAEAAAEDGEILVEEPSLEELLGEEQAADGGDGGDGGDKAAAAGGEDEAGGGDLLDDLLDEEEDGDAAAAETAKPTPAAKPTANAKPGGGGDPLDDLLDDVEDETGKADGAAKAADAAKPAGGGDLLDDLLDDVEEEHPELAAKGAPAAATAGGGDSDDLLDDLLDDDGEVKADDDLADKGATDSAPTPSPAAVAAASEWGPPPTSSAFKTFCAAETRLSGVQNLAIKWLPFTMVLLLLFCAFVTTARRHHIALRTPRTAREDRVSQAAQLASHLLLAYSAYHFLEFTTETQATLQKFWVAGMVLLASVNVFHLFVPIEDEPGAKTSGTGAFLGIPLYATMTGIVGLWFLLGEDYPSGPAVYLDKLTTFSALYIQVGLYLWTGMLLRDTALGRVLFDILRPLRLPAELLAVLVVIAAAGPTAYSGASGILVLAVGATIYTELVRAGANKQRALAATAMSGSLGVVLPPCLLVVIVASLNLDVTTDELFHRGWQVFGLSALLFTAVSYFTRSEPWRFEPAPNAGAAMKKAFGRLLPYIVIAVALIGGYGLLMDIGFNEHTAPYVLPLAMIAVMPWDRIVKRRAAADEPDEKERSRILAKHPTMLDAGTHIGALLMLMGLSACLGGVIERSEIIELFPQVFPSAYAAMAVLVVVLVLIGMVMDPYGAVILVTVTLYPIAKANGISPLNFWMVALISFELGYVTPPVALNHLLTRQVVRDVDPSVEDLEVEGGTFFERHERIIVPIAVLATTLLVVAFGPLLVGS